MQSLLLFKERLNAPTSILQLGDAHFASFVAYFVNTATQVTDEAAFGVHRNPTPKVIFTGCSNRRRCSSFQYILMDAAWEPSDEYINERKAPISRATAEKYSHHKNSFKTPARDMRSIGV